MDKILDINKFIKEVNAEEVTNFKMFNYVNGEPVPTEDGIFSYKIFGQKFSKERNEKWGWFNLNTEIINPAALLIMDKITPAFRNIALRKRKYSVKNGELVPDKNGNWGIQFLKTVIKTLDWKKIPEAENKKAFISKIFDADPNKIFINKWHIVPAGVRDFNVKDGRPIYDEINEKYSNTIYTCRNKVSQKSLNFLGQADKDQDVAKETVVQKLILDIHEYFIDKLSGKNGIVKGALIKKKTDFVARLVASSSPYIPPLGAAVPWHALINLFALFVIHEIENNEQYKKAIFGDNNAVSLNEYSKLFQYIFKNASMVSKKNPEIKKTFIEILTKILNEKSLKITMKRDPAFGDTSWWGLYPIIDKGDNYNIKLNSIYYSPIGGDSVDFKTVWKMRHKSFVSNASMVMQFDNGIYQYMDFEKYMKKVKK